MASLTWWTHVLGFSLAAIMLTGEVVRETGTGHAWYLVALGGACGQMLFVVRAVRLYRLRMAYERLRITMDKRYAEWQAVDYMRTQLQKEGHA